MSCRWTKKGLLYRVIYREGRRRRSCRWRWTKKEREEEEGASATTKFGIIWAPMWIKEQKFLFMPWFFSILVIALILFILFNSKKYQSFYTLIIDILENPCDCKSRPFNTFSKNTKIRKANPSILKDREMAKRM